MSTQIERVFEKISYPQSLPLSVPGKSPLIFPLLFPRRSSYSYFVGETCEMGGD